MAGISEAGHTESHPDTPVPLITLASCPVPDRPDDSPLLWGKMKISVRPGSKAYTIYRQNEVYEPFTCSYELNPDFKGELEAAGLIVSGEGEDASARIIELPGDRFYIGTGYVPQMTSEASRPHPLIVAFLKAVTEFRKARLSDNQS